MDSPLSSPSDWSLLEAVRSGDRQALDALVERYQPHVYRFGMALCHDQEDARDVLQDTFLAMVRSLHTFRAESSLSTWLYSIAHRACLKKRRRPISRPRHLESLEALDGAERERLHALTRSPEASAAATEIQVALRAAIGTLGPAQRAVLMLRDVEGLTAVDTARTLGLSVAAVKSRLHRARHAVRSALAPALKGGLSSPKPARRCPDVAAQLSQHLEGDLTPEACASLEAHLEECLACRGVCESLRQMLASCRAAPLPHVPEPTQQRIRELVRACLDRPAQDTSCGPSSQKRPVAAADGPEPAQPARDDQVG